MYLRGLCNVCLAGIFDRTVYVSKSYVYCIDIRQDYVLSI